MNLRGTLHTARQSLGSIDLRGAAARTVELVRHPPRVTMADLDVRKMNAAQRVQLAERVAIAVVVILLLWALFRAGRLGYEKYVTVAGLESDFGVSAAAAAPPPAKPAGKESGSILSLPDIFNRPKPKKYEYKVTGVLGDQVIFNNDTTVKVGEKYQEATITKIGPDFVDLTDPEGTKHLEVFAPGAISTANPVGNDRYSRGRGGPGFGGGPPSPGMRGPGGRSFDLSQDRLNEMAARWRSMPAEQREAALNRMPPEMANQIRQRIGQ